MSGEYAESNLVEKTYLLIIEERMIVVKIKINFC